jgi:2-phospho-L-lactate guanylyltransferase (CobY/MobA/RfbA family)
MLARKRTEYRVRKTVSVRMLREVVHEAKGKLREIDSIPPEERALVAQKRYAVMMYVRCVGEEKGDA